MNETNKTENESKADNKPVREKAAARPAVKAGKGSFCCYLGPSLTGFLRHGDILDGALAEARKQAAAAIEKVPSIRTLIVSKEALPAAQIKIKTPGNALYEAYRRVLTEWKEGAVNG